MIGSIMGHALSRNALTIFGNVGIGGWQCAEYGSEVCGEGCRFFFVSYAPDAVVLLKQGDMRYWSLKLLGGFPNGVVFFGKTRDICFERCVSYVL